MKTNLKLFFLLGFTLILIYNTNAQKTFKIGEQLEYRIYFQSLLTGKLSAGNGTITVEEASKFNSEDVVSIQIKGKTKGFIQFFYKVKDRFRSYFDVKNKRPIAFIKDVKEGSYTKYDSVIFNYEQLKAFGSYDTTNISSQLTDVASVMYYVRELDFEPLTIGKTYQIPIFMDDEIFYSTIKFIGYKNIKTKNKTYYNCIGFIPSASTESFFEKEELGTVWFSNDKNRLPVLVESELQLGFIKLELLHAKGIDLD